MVAHSIHIISVAFSLSVFSSQFNNEFDGWILFVAHVQHLSVCWMIIAFLKETKSPKKKVQLLAKHKWSKPFFFCSELKIHNKMFECYTTTTTNYTRSHQTNFIQEMKKNKNNKHPSNSSNPFSILYPIYSFRLHFTNLVWFGFGFFFYF